MLLKELAHRISKFNFNLDSAVSRAGTEEEKKNFENVFKFFKFFKYNYYGLKLYHKLYQNSALENFSKVVYTSMDGRKFTSYEYNSDYFKALIIGSDEKGIKHEGSLVNFKYFTLYEFADGEYCQIPFLGSKEDVEKLAEGGAKFSDNNVALELAIQEKIKLLPFEDFDI